MRDEKIKLEEWGISKNDPGSWLRIPEFGINPIEVNFKGFDFPVFENLRHEEDFVLRMALSHMVRSSRELAQQRFTSLISVEDLGYSSLKNFRKYQHPAMEGKRPQFSEDEIFAMNFCSAIEGFKGYLIGRQKSDRYYEFANGCHSFAELACHNKLDEEFFRKRIEQGMLEKIKERNQKASSKSALARADKLSKNEIHKNWSAWQESSDRLSVNEWKEATSTAYGVKIDTLRRWHEGWQRDIKKA